MNNKTVFVCGNGRRRKQVAVDFTNKKFYTNYPGVMAANIILQSEESMKSLKNALSQSEFTEINYLNKAAQENYVSSNSKLHICESIDEYDDYYYNGDEYVDVDHIVDNFDNDDFDDDFWSSSY